MEKIPPSPHASSSSILFPCVPQDRPFGEVLRVAWTVSGETLVQLVERAGLCGKGGAGFATHKKMALMRRQAGKRKFLVVNGSEHEPGSLKDRYLLEKNPERVFEGACIMAHAVGATTIIVAINEEASGPIGEFQEVVEQAARMRLLHDSGIEVLVHYVPDVYIAGQESALLEAIEGRNRYRGQRRRIRSKRGLWGCPTLVQNVETVAHLPFILEYGAQAYRECGTYGKGVTLCSFGPEFNHPGVHEVPLEAPIHVVLYEFGGGLRDGSPIKAIQPGGPSSGFLPASLFDLPFDARTLAEHGAALGCAAIRAYSDKACMVHELGKIMGFFARGSCGQCPKCKMETQMLTSIMSQVHGGKANWDLVDRITEILKFASGGGLCSLIDMPIAPMRTGLLLFKEEFAAHIEGGCGRCGAIAATRPFKDSMASGVQ